MRNVSFIIFYCLFFSFNSWPSIPLIDNSHEKNLEKNLDDQLDLLINQFKFSAISAQTQRQEGLFQLGRQLFFERQLSTYNNISCHDCHLPRLGTGDQLPFSIGQGGINLGPLRRQGSGLVVKRNAPPLFNLHQSHHTELFHDGRVAYFPLTKRFLTPEAKLNGRKPLLQEITTSLSGALAAQSLFPMVDEIEMLGANDQKLENQEIWDNIVKRIIKIPAYQDLLKKAYPDVCLNREVADCPTINIGHFGSALAHFQEIAFHIDDTPWDRYLRGEKEILSLEEKKGVILFATKAKCTNCHFGEYLTDFQYHNILTPNLNRDEQTIDEGRYAIEKKDKFYYAFKTPGLRNVALTAPYFHNGSFFEIDEIIEHYINPILSFHLGSLHIQEKYRTNYLNPLWVNDVNKELILSNLDPSLELNLELDDQEKEYLKLFLKKSLSSPRWLR